jgi:hypothetical protein
MIELDYQIERLEALNDLISFKVGDICPLHVDHDSLQLMLKEDRASFVHWLKIQIRTSTFMLKIWRRYMELEELQELLKLMAAIPNKDIVSLFMLLEEWINKGVAHRYPKGQTATLSSSVSIFTS